MNPRIIKALARKGLEIAREGPVYRVRRRDAAPCVPTAEVLLPAELPLETRALLQLTEFAGVRHPSGAGTHRVCATPDIHAGHEVPVGSIVAAANLVVPQAIGTDINCGMRLHVADIDVDEWQRKREPFLEALKGDLLLGTRDLPTTPAMMRGLYRAGAPGWLEELRKTPMGMLARCDLDELEHELERCHELGSHDGDPRWGPDATTSEARAILRDPGLATIGGGNHFVEIQRVDEIMDRGLAHHWKLRAGQLAIMIHSGSRNVGLAIGRRWADIARERWPQGQRRPRLLSLVGEDAREYLTAMNTAANYASVNRLLLAEQVRQRLREFHGARDVPLVFDLPHNIISRENGLFVHRKGATPAHEGQPVPIPGSMGHPSYLMVGRGHERFLNSCSHGAGRAQTRFAMTRRGRAHTAEDLDGVHCITLRRQRILEEAPSAYKNIEHVVQIQVDMGLVGAVARLMPLATFKA